MQAIIQHSLNTTIAKEISSNFKVFSTHIRHQSDTNLDTLRDKFKIDFNYIPKVDFSQIKLFVSDMDSTLINIECIDEIADFANLKPQVAKITQQAMQGEINFDKSLIKRVALLKDLDIKVLNEVYEKKLNLNMGADKLIEFFQKKQIKTSVVSGGFTYFTNRIKDDLLLDYAHSNTLEVLGNKLTGKVIGNIVNSHAKANFVKKLCTLENINTKQVIVAGDGANDLEMMKVAGVSIAYHAKDKVKKYADIVIDYDGFDKITDFFV